MKKYVSIAIVALLLSLCFSVNSVSSSNIETTTEGTTLYVDDDFNETTPGWNVTSFSIIKNAIAKAEDNDTVFVYNGTYYEHNIQIRESISLIGENKETTIIDGEGIAVFIIFGNNVTLVNFTIQNGSLGIDIMKCSNIYILNNNIISNQFYGIRGEYTSDLTIRGNSIFYSINSGIFFTSLTGTNVVELNNINSNGLAISTWGSFNLEVKNNNIENNGFFSNNNFLSPFFQVKFDNGLGGNQSWTANYWGRPLLFPMPIFGSKSGGVVYEFDLMVMWDKHPAKEPYDIGGS